MTNDRNAFPEGWGNQGWTCPKCGQNHFRHGKPTCRGHNRNTGLGEPCMRWPLRGGWVCVRHGGNLETTKLRAQERLQAQWVRGAVAEALEEVELADLHPMDGLRELVRHSGAMFRMLGLMVGELGFIPGARDVVGMDHLGHPIYKVTGFTGFNHLGEEVPHIAVQMYGEWADRYAKMCKLALDAGLDERMVRNAELTASVVYGVIIDALKKVQLTELQAAQLRREIALGMRAAVDPVQFKGALSV